MHVNVRKLIVGLVVLGALLVVYFAYLRFGDTPILTAESSPAAPGPVAEAAELEGEGAVGTIGGVGVGRIQQTRFTHRNESNEVDRVFGFVELRNQQGDQWEITRPYMKLFFPGFRCDVTADRGKVQVETAFGRPMANDAQFSGNVVIHVIPVNPDDLLEFFIHLDDVGFLAEKSLFTSSGDVRFLSRIAQLTGTGMELLYDAARSRLELFRIFDLESLRLRSSEFGALTGLESQGSPEGRQASAQASAPKPSEPMETPGDLYQCVFRENVTIRTADRLIAARDILTIDHIVRNRSAELERVADPNVAEPLPLPGPDGLDTAPSPHPVVAAIPEEAFDVVVACDGGFTITPMAVSTGALLANAEAGEKPSTSREPMVPSDRQYLTARRIDLNAATSDAVLTGPVEMVFPVDPNGLTGEQVGGDPVPVTVTAQESVRYVAASNHILLEGGCTVDALRDSELSLRQEYHLAAPRLVLDVIGDPNAQDKLAVRVRKFVADGGPVALRIMRRGPDGLLGWTRVEAWALQYDRAPQEFEIIGPGYVWLHNAEADPKADANGFSLRWPCYARLSNFDTLTYSEVESRIVAKDDGRQLLLDYFPLVDDEYTRHIVTVGGHVEAELDEVNGRTELAGLTVSEGIQYEDEVNHFVGSSLVYDHATDLVIVHGDDVLPCTLNSALVDEIEMNAKTGRLKTEIPGPTVLQVRR